MLPSFQRLRRREVLEVLKKGRNLPSGKYLSAKAYAPIQKEASKIGNATMRCTAVVSLKIARTNVVRNRLRRTLYDAVRTTNPAQIKSKPLHIVFFIKSIPEGKIRQAFTEDIDKILNVFMVRS